MAPSQAQDYGVASRTAVITGFPQFVEANSEFTGFIMMPISTGKTMTFMMVPIIDYYDVYELRDNETSQEFIIAHARGTARLPETEIRCGGVLKELNSSTSTTNGNAPSKFLESIYYARA
ncbi:hypothetical protein BVY04_02600 [bacterium M21]|nr:hypothetical protein BVY04_02600 [bacterium M21]